MARPTNGPRLHVGNAERGTGIDGAIGLKRAFDFSVTDGFNVDQSEPGTLVEYFDKLPAANASLALADASGGSGPNAAAFLQYTAISRDFELLGTNPLVRHVAHGIELKTTGADADSAILAPHLDTATVDSIASVPVTRWSCGAWKAQNRVNFLSRIRTQKILTITNVAQATTTVSVTTATTHNLSIGQSVTIAIATGPTSAQMSATNGTYVVAALTSTTIFTVTAASATINTVASTGFVTPNNLKLQTIWTGLKKTNTATAATDADQFYIRYLDSEASGKFQVMTSRATTLVTTILPIAPVPNTVYNIRFQTDAAYRPSVWINGQYFNLKCRECGESGTDGSAPLTRDVSLIPYTATSANGTTPGTKTLDVLGGYSISALSEVA